MRARTSSERRVGRRNLVAGILFGVIVATVAGAYATTVFKKMVAGKPATAADVNQAHQDLATAIDNLEKKVTAQAAEITKLKTDPDCPPGYTKDTTVTAYTLCVSGKDEMVKVGSFWVDRYEAILVDATTYNGGKCDGAGTYYPGGGTPYPSGFPADGNWTTPVYACSLKGPVPSRDMTWFMAAQACELAGKKLCSNYQWQVAAAGTHDPGKHSGVAASPCHTDGGGPRKTGLAGSVPGSTGSCISRWGAEDMVGNLSEWVSMWTVAGRAWMTLDAQSTAPWPSSYGDGKDSTNNLDGTAYGNSTIKHTNGLPAAALRGGSALDGEPAGVFAFNLNNGPTAWHYSYGTRCCRE